MILRMNVLYSLLLLLSAHIALGKSVNHTKVNKTLHSKHNAIKATPKTHHERNKRSIDEEEDPFWPNRGKKLLTSYSDLNEPFWATRGRRDSSEESFVNAQKNYKHFVPQNVKFCEDCYPPSYSDEVNGNIKHARDDVVTPFWGHRGRRSSEELTDNNNNIPDDLFWGSRGRRQENEPFWGNRGRREEDLPFWGHRGRREEEPFWGNRGRRQEDPPFWGHRGRREEEPFWGNRGRREETDPFWGNRGRRDDHEPFWGNKGRRKESSEPFWDSKLRRKEDLKESILEAINDVENNIENLSRLRRSNYDSSFWSNRSRESKLKHLFHGPPRNKPYQSFLVKPTAFGTANPLGPGTVHDNRIYAEEPHYIIVERNSRSSGEVDPYYISRGKKYYIDLDLAKAARDRRGAIEEIVKSVRNDPYYIARGKKDPNPVKIGNTTMPHEEFVKAKELICATVELIMIKNGTPKSKREIDDNDRDRRTILKKLAAQLQMDPYFVSRGKKSDDNGNKDDYLQDFINEVAGKCT